MFKRILSALSESLFKTMKYRPAYPQRRFENLLAARHWVGTFVHWYNEEHRHSAIGFVTPSQRHASLNVALLGKRAEVYKKAKAPSSRTILETIAPLDSRHIYKSLPMANEAETVPYFQRDVRLK